ncbi:MAG TPA: hypothetical protein VGC76_15855 [Pyrinomonadaceae bacterium]|jgi:hypothetical protein
MNWKEIVIKELKEILELTNYISDDFQANERLKAIREKVVSALHIIEDIQ